MNKIRGKVLSLVLAAALVVSSFPATFASASSHHTESGDVSDTDRDEIYLVNGGKEDASTNTHTLTYKDIQHWIFQGKSCTLETKDHNVVDAKISDISHSSGDRLVKWYDGADMEKQKSITDDTNAVNLQLRSNSVEGHEVLKVQYEGSYTDDDDKEITVKGTKDFDVYVMDKNGAVVGEVKEKTDGQKAELDDDFAQKTVNHEIKKQSLAGNISDNDSKELSVYLATSDNTDCLAQWKQVKTVTDETKVTKDGKTYSYSDEESQDLATTDKDQGIYYTLKSSTDSIQRANTDADGNKAAVDEPSKEATTSTPGYTSDGTDAAGSTKITLAGVKTADTTDYDYMYKVSTSALSTLAYADGTVYPTTAPKASELGLNDKNTHLYVAAFNKTTNDFVCGQDFTWDNDTTAFTAPTSLAATDALPGLTASDEETTSEATTYAIDPVKGTAPDYKYTYAVNGDPAKPAEDNSNVIAADSDLTFADVTGLKDLAAGRSATVKIAAYKQGTGTAYDTLVEGSTISFTYTAAAAAADIGLGTVTATVKDGASTGSVTFTAVPSYWAKNHKDEDGNSIIADSKDVKTKCKINKEIKVGNSGFERIGKYSGTTYLYSGTLDKTSYDNKTNPATAVKVNGYEINFPDDATATVTVDDKASVYKITGKVSSLTVSSGSVNEIALDDGNVTVDDAKVGNIKTKNGKTVTVNSKATVGDITVEDDGIIDLDSAKAGKLDATTVNITADEDDVPVSVSDITVKNLSIDSKDSKVEVGTVTSKDADGEFDITGSNVAVKGFDFDYRNTNLKFDDFQGKIAAPKNASEDGATISTTNGDDRVEVTGDTDVDAVSIEDDSKLTFDGKLNVTSVDGSGELDIAAGKMYIDGDVSGATLRLTDPTLTVGQTVFTALSDTVDADDFDCYGFTLAKSEGSKVDTLKIDSVQFKGVTINKVSSEIAKGQSETFTASAYPGGTSIPAGYKVEWSLNDYNDDVFALTVNTDGSATVKAIGYDTDFASENKATLKAQLLDASGDEVDEDEYPDAECALTAVAVPAQKFTSDTTGNKAMKLGQTYQFAITSTDGSKPSFAVASAGATVSYAGASGNKYFYKVKAAKVGSYGVYAGGTKVAILVISSDVTLDTSKVTVKAGASYQFEATAPKQPVFQVAGIGTIALRSHSGSNYYFKVTVPSKTAKGGHGVYVNGVRMAVLTVA